MEQLDNVEIVENFDKSRKLENHVKGGEIKEEGEEVEERERDGKGKGKREGEGGDVAEGGVTGINGDCS